MNAKTTHQTRRIDLDLTPSPSTGAKETAGAMHAIYGLGEPDREPPVEYVEYRTDILGVSS